jgi:hypothetical protein
MNDLHEYKCPACGGALAFDTELQMLKCPYCDTTYDPQKMNVASDEDVANNAMSADSTQQGQNELFIYLCNSCGGEIVADASTGATSCPYCNNPVVMIGQFSGTVRPNYILPFKLDKKRAVAALKRHYRKKPFLPSVFTTQNKINDIKGIYVPFWHFSAFTEASIEYTGQKIKTWSDSNYEYTETSRYKIVREGAVSYSYVPVDASWKMPDDLMNSLEPYDLNEAVGFNTAYMAGFLADKFDVDRESSEPRANQRMSLSTERSFSESITGFQRLNITHKSINFSDVTAQYIMLPVWYLSTTWNGEEYVFAMNGQTGKLIGELPVDKNKSKLATFLLTIGFFGIFVALYLAAIGGM